MTSQKQNPRLITHKRTESEEQSPTSIVNDVQKDIQMQKEMGGQLHKFHQTNSEHDLLLCEKKAMQMNSS